MGVKSDNVGAVVDLSFKDESNMVAHKVAYSILQNSLSDEVKVVPLCYLWQHKRILLCFDASES